MTIAAIIPAHNAERFLAQTLDSVSAQTLPPREVIVIVDNSDDATLEIARNHAAPTLVIETNHKNAAAARNTGINLAESRYIAFLDADDMWKPHHLERFSQLIGPDDVGYTCWCDLVTEDGSSITERTCGWPVAAPVNGLEDEQYLRWYRGKNHFAMLTTIVDRERFLEVGGFDESQVRRHDLDMWLRVIHTKTWTFNPESVAQYRIVSDGISYANWASSEYYHLRMLDKNVKQWDSLRTEVLTWCRRSLAAALTDGTREDYKRAYEIASRHMSPKGRAFFTAASLCPPAFRLANKIRRRQLMKS